MVSVCLLVAFSFLFFLLFLALIHTMLSERLLISSYMLYDQIFSFWQIGIYIYFIVIWYIFSRRQYVLMIENEFSISWIWHYILFQANLPGTTHTSTKISEIHLYSQHFFTNFYGSEHILIHAKQFCVYNPFYISFLLFFWTILWQVIDNTQGQT